MPTLTVTETKVITENVNDFPTRIKSVRDDDYSGNGRGRVGTDIAIYHYTAIPGPFDAAHTRVRLRMIGQPIRHTIRWDNISGINTLVPPPLAITTFEPLRHHINFTFRYEVLQVGSNPMPPTPGQGDIAIDRGGDMIITPVPGELHPMSLFLVYFNRGHNHTPGVEERWALAHGDFAAACLWS